MRNFLLVLVAVMVVGCGSQGLQSDGDKLAYSMGQRIAEQFETEGMPFEKELFKQGVEDSVADRKNLLTSSPPPEELVNSYQKIASYGSGFQIGETLKDGGVEANLEALLAGADDVLKKENPKVPHEEQKERMQAFFQKMTEIKRKEMEELASKNAKEGRDFLQENAKREGVKVLPSGLQYKVLNEGEGKSPEVSSHVVTHYRGTLLDGTQFDSSYDRGEPAAFPVNGVIAGWTEALQLMKEGSKWELYVPSDLAYGSRGAPPDIGPGATLIFEVELLKVR